MLKKIFKFLTFASVTFLLIGAGTLNSPKFISPDSRANKEIKGKPVDQIEYLRFEYEDGKLTLDPKLPLDWTWFAGKGFTAGEKDVQFFFWSGILFTNHPDLKYTSFQSKEYKEVFSDVRANAFVICFKRHDETVLFTAVDKEQDVEITIPEKYLGKELNFNFHLKDNEAKFLRISSTNPPFKP